MELFQATFTKYVVVVALFAVFLVLANVWHFRNRERLARAHTRRRRRRRAPGRPEAPELPSPSFWSRAFPWVSAAALLLCVAALVAMWFAMSLAAVNG